MNAGPENYVFDDVSRLTESARHMERARRLIVRGVGSALRASQRPVPLVVESASGSQLIDVDGNRYIDYVLGYGPIVLGHRPPRVIEAVEEQLRRGVLFGAQHRGELALAERIVRLVPSAEMIAFGNTGSEAVHAAIRFARAATGRTRILKFEGHYHGWIDPVHVNGPGAPPAVGDPPLPVRHSVPGLPPPDNVLVARWNDTGELTALLAEYGAEVAAVLMEPVPCNFGNFEADPGYLAEVRRLCDRWGCVLIFDEVITGFRLGLGGAQHRYGVTPDVTVLAKAVGSGFPLSVVAGRKSVMEVAANGPVRHVGTYNGSPVAVAAAVATLDELETGGGTRYAALEGRSSDLARELTSAAGSAGAPLVVNRVGSVLQLLWGPVAPVRTYADAYRSDRAAVADLAAHLLARGVNALERGLWFLSCAHSAEDIERTAAAARVAIRLVAQQRAST